MIDLGGRPTKYDPSFCSMVIEHMSQGLSFESFAGLIEVDRSTLYNWVKDYPDFERAKGIALEKSRLFWEKLGIQHILNESESTTNVGSSSKSLNSAVWCFNMKNRFGWRDKQPDEDTTNVTVNNVPLTPELIKELIKEARGA